MMLETLGASLFFGLRMGGGGGGGEDKHCKKKKKRKEETGHLPCSPIKKKGGLEPNRGKKGRSADHSQYNRNHKELGGAEAQGRGGGARPAFTAADRLAKEEEKNSPKLRGKGEKEKGERSARAP